MKDKVNALANVADCVGTAKPTRTIEPIRPSTIFQMATRPQRPVLLFLIPEWATPSHLPTYSTACDWSGCGTPLVVTGTTVAKYPSYLVIFFGTASLVKAS